MKGILTIIGVFILAVILGLTSLSFYLKRHEERLTHITYIDYLKGYKLTTEKGNVRYFQPSAVEKYHFVVGNPVNFLMGGDDPCGTIYLKQNSTDSLWAKIVYFKFIQTKRDPNQVPPDFYSGYYEGIAIPDTSKIDVVVIFISPEQPTLGAVAKLTTGRGINGERIGWELK